jgi:hypothetical protein
VEKTFPSTLIDGSETVDWERSRGEEHVLIGSDEDTARTSDRTSNGGRGSGQAPAAASSVHSGQSRTNFLFGISRDGPDG